MILEGSASKAQNLKLRAIGDLLNNADEDSESDSLESDHEEDYSSLGLSATTRKAQQSFLAEEDLISRISELARNRGMELTQREWATLIALGSMSRVLPFRHNDIVGARAMLMHIAILGDCKLSERAVVVPRCQASEAFMRTYVEALYEILTSEFWQNMIARVPCKCDLGDAIDGRLFLATAKALQPHNAQAFGSSTLEKVETLATALVRLFNLDVRPIAAHSPKWCDTTECNGLASSTEQPRKSGQTEEALTVLPFHNPVIDAHLEPVRVVVSDKASPSPSGSMSRIFQELSHWHNHKRPLDNRRKITLTERQQMFAHRRNQRFMTDTARYAASLTNAVGGSLTPETVFVKSQSEKAMKQPRAPHAGGTPYSSTARKENTSTQHKKTGKGTVSVRDQIAAERQSKQLEEFNKHFANWRTSIEGLERVPDNIARYVKVKAHLKAHLTNLPADKASALRPEILAYMLSILVNAWKEKCDTSERQHSVHILALIWQVIQDIGHLKKGVTEDIAREVQRTVRAIRLPPIEMRIEGTRKLPFEFAELSTRNDAFALRSTPTKLQLLHAGPYMDRSMGSAPDLRVRAFEPDKWQREVLDQIDARKSLFVVAPTSAGKTFIS
jgi:hypothetical protein